MTFMIRRATLMEATNTYWPEFVALMTLQCANGFISCVKEKNAANVIDVLKEEER